jgi:predicted PurR-regulated permease PerM
VEIVYFTLVAIGLYFLSDALLDWIERRRGARFEQRSIVFFVIILALSLVTFQVLSRLFGRG